MRRNSRYLVTTIAVVCSLVLGACAGGSSDVVGGESPTSDGEGLILVAYAVPKNGWDAIAVAFGAGGDSEESSINGDYGPSGNQSRKVVDGAPADIVNFSVEPDMTRLVDAGLVDEVLDVDALHVADRLRHLGVRLLHRVVEALVGDGRHFDDLCDCHGNGVG